MYVSSMRRTFFELGGVAGLVLAATLVGQLFFPNRIPFFTTYIETETASGMKLIPSVLVNRTTAIETNDKSSDSEESVQENPAPIGTQAAYKIFNAKNGIIIDARDLREFEAGHITGAWNIPYAEFFDHLEILDPLPKDTLIVTYCDGEECNASMELANELVSMGFSRVRFYFGGWIAWTQAEYPTTSGPAL